MSGGATPIAAEEIERLKAIGAEAEEAKRRELEAREARAPAPEFGPEPVSWLQFQVTRLLPKLKKLRLDDQGLAQRFLLLCGDDIRFCEAWRSWLFFDGMRWTKDNLKVQLLASQVQEMLLLEAAASEGERRSQLAQAAIKAGRAQAIVDLLFCARAHVPIKPEELDAKPHLLAFKNGTLDLRPEGGFREAWRDDYGSKLVPFDFDEFAEAPLWDRVVSQAMLDDQGMVDYLQRALGSALIGRVRDHKLHIGIGSGANSKGTLCRAIQHALGADYCMEAPAGLLLRRGSEAHPTRLADLKGMRLCFCQEVGVGKQLDEELIKRLSGGDRIRARRMHCDFEEFRASHSIFVFANHRPQVDETGPALWRRLTLIPFEFTVPADQIDLDLDEKLQAEAQGVLVWLVKGYRRYLELGLAEPERVKEATKAYERDSDTLGDFILECCFVHVDASAGAQQFINAFSAWCKAAGREPFSAGRLKEELFRRGFDQKKEPSGLFWKGVGLAAE